MRQIGRLARGFSWLQARQNQAPKPESTAPQLACNLTAMFPTTAHPNRLERSPGNRLPRRGAELSPRRLRGSPSRQHHRLEESRPFRASCPSETIPLHHINIDLAPARSSPMPRQRLSWLRYAARIPHIVTANFETGRPVHDCPYACRSAQALLRPNPMQLADPSFALDRTGCLPREHSPPAAISGILLTHTCALSGFTQSPSTHYANPAQAAAQ